MAARCVVSFVAALALAVTPVAAPTRAQDGGERLHVVASFSILADVARSVAGDAADVASLMPLDADPHSFVPTPRDLVTMVDADVVFTVGANFEESLAETIRNAGEGVNIVTASACVEILPFGGDAHGDEATDEHAAEGTSEAHAAGTDLAKTCEAHHAELAALAEPAQRGDGHESQEPGETHEHLEPLGMLYAIDCGGAHAEPPDDHAGEGHTHEAGTCDPHVWMDPRNAMLWALMVRDTLSALDPDGAATYDANAAAYLAELARLTDEVWSPALAAVPEGARKLVTNHNAFGYLAHAFDYTVMGVVIPGGGTMAQPGAAEVAALIDAIRAEGVPAIFTETTTNPQLAQQIADEAGVAVYRLYTGSLSDADGPAATYIDYMTYNIGTIAAALGGAAQ